ncbi:COG4315 family predicted lipoprotein [Nonomuraea sediminis]|uniref:COG4315 family predicted lipoprotein n=1 Tax=Nonomuraea sediminis TaxID=2835864 RepID=UPI001BDCE16B|nr:hypothetical protein [Nonomuraea sediminis]
MRKALLVPAFLLVAGCGSTGTTTQQAAPSPTPTGYVAKAAPSPTPYVAGNKQAAASPTPSTYVANQAAAQTVKAAKTKLGEVIVTGKGMTLYHFEKEEDGTPACYGPCTGEWKPYITQGKPTATEGAKVDQVSMVARKDGTMQVTYGGHPVYTYADDKKPGDTTGQEKNEFGAEWYAVKTNGQAME